MCGRDDTTGDIGRDIAHESNARHSVRVGWIHKRDVGDSVEDNGREVVGDTGGDCLKETVVDRIPTDTSQRDCTRV